MLANALQICRDYGQPLEWWEAQPGHRQAIYLADLERRARR